MILDMHNYLLTQGQKIIVSIPEAQVSPTMMVEATASNKKPITISRLPIASTFCIFHQPHALLSDPNDTEETLSKETMTIVMDTTGHVYRVYKNGGNSIGPEVLKTCFERAEQRTQEMTELILQTTSL